MCCWTVKICIFAFQRALAVAQPENMQKSTAIEEHEEDNGICIYYENNETHSHWIMHEYLKVNELNVALQDEKTNVHLSNKI